MLVNPHNVKKSKELDDNSQTKNEPVVGRNIFHGARPREGAWLTPWLWIGRTKEVGTLGIG